MKECEARSGESGQEWGEGKQVEVELCDLGERPISVNSVASTVDAAMLLIILSLTMSKTH